MSPLTSAAWAFAAGALIPVMGILNGTLARATGQPLWAAVILFAVGLALCAALALMFGGPPSTAFLAAPPHLFVGGAIVAFYVVSVTVLAPRFGVGNTILFAMTAQILTSAAIDHFGLFGAPVRSLDGLRLGGIALMLAGLTASQLPARG